MRFLLRDEQRRQNLIDYIKSLDINTLYQVDIKKFKRNRSNSQNNLMWMWLQAFADYSGYTEEELHERFKVKLLGVVERITSDVLVIMPKSTADLSTKEFTEYLNKIEILARWLELQLPYPDDYKIAMGLQWK